MSIILIQDCQPITIRRVLKLLKLADVSEVQAMHSIALLEKGFVLDKSCLPSASVLPGQIPRAHVDAIPPEVQPVVSFLSKANNSGVLFSVEESSDPVDGKPLAGFTWILTPSGDGQFHWSITLNRPSSFNTVVFTIQPEGRQSPTVKDYRRILRSLTVKDYRSVAALEGFHEVGPLLGGKLFWQS